MASDSSSDDQHRQQVIRVQIEQLVAENHRLVLSLLEKEARKSDNLPILSGHKAYSQNDEDGILLDIFGRLGIRSGTFFEIGVGNGMENNTLFWLKQGWNGVWVDGSGDNAKFINKYFAHAYTSGSLVFREVLVSAENIPALVNETGFGMGDVDLVSIDIDGNDYYIFPAIARLSPKVVVIEYNAIFPPPICWRIPYDANYCWDGTDWFGASLQSMANMFGAYGYTLVACNLTGANAFFVREDLLEGKFPLAGNVGALYQPPRYFLTSGYYSKIGGHMASNQLAHLSE